MKSKTKFLSFLIVLSLVLFGCSKITSDIVNSTKDITNIENTNKPEETLKPGYVKIKLGIGNYAGPGRYLFVLYSVCFNCN